MFRPMIIRNRDTLRNRGRCISKTIGKAARLGADVGVVRVDPTSSVVSIHSHIPARANQHNIPEEVRREGESRNKLASEPNLHSVRAEKTSTHGRITTRQTCSSGLR